MHSAKCDEYTARSKAAIEAFEKAWPNHCKPCDATGVRGFYQSHPYGMGSAQEYLEEPCDDCGGRCPLCGGEVDPDTSPFYAEATPCPHGCGFNWSKSELVRPPEWECWGECEEESPSVDEEMARIEDEADNFGHPAMGNPMRERVLLRHLRKALEEKHEDANRPPPWWAFWRR